jgi:hypothetical protein
LNLGTPFLLHLELKIWVKQTGISLQENLMNDNRIRLELSSICQLKCPVCLTALGITNKLVDTPYVSFKKFKDLIDTSPQIKYIETSHQGEVFLNPDLLNIIHYSNQIKWPCCRVLSKSINISQLSEAFQLPLIYWYYKKKALLMLQKKPFIYPEHYLILMTAQSSC